MYTVVIFSCLDRCWIIIKIQCKLFAQASSLNSNRRAWNRNQHERKGHIIPIHPFVTKREIFRRYNSHHNPR